MNAKPTGPHDLLDLSGLSERTRALLEEYRAERRRIDEEDAAMEEESKAMGICVNVGHHRYCGPPPAMFSRSRDTSHLIRFRLPAGDVERTDCFRRIPEHLREASFAELLDYLIVHEMADHAQSAFVYLLDKVLSGNFIESKDDNHVTIW